jgi:hypothetical protein
VKIILRAGSGFCREELMRWCEHNGVGYALGLARNQRLSKIIGAQMHQAHALHQSTGKAARVFADSAIGPKRAGRAPAAWWLSASISTRAKTRASW